MTLRHVPELPCSVPATRHSPLVLAARGFQSVNRVLLRVHGIVSGRIGASNVSRAAAHSRAGRHHFQQLASVKREIALLDLIHRRTAACGFLVQFRVRPLARVNESL